MKKVGWFLLLILPLAAYGQSQSPDEVVAEFWQHSSALEFEEANQLLSAEMQLDPDQLFAELEGQERLLAEASYAKMSAEPREPEITGDTAVVMVEVSGPALGAVFRSVTQQLFGMAVGGLSGEQFSQLAMEMMIREVNSDSVPISRGLVEHRLVIEDGRWKISAIDEGAFNRVLGMPEAEPAP